MEVELLPVPAAGAAHGAPPCFDCSICLEPAREPVVTPCGHLYCRPCVRRWMRSALPGANQCPVCKAHVSEGRLRPLYARRQRRAPPFATVDPRRQSDGGLGLGFDVRSMDATIDNLMHGQPYGNHWGWVLHSNAGCLIGSAAVAVLPWAFPGRRLSSVPRRLVIVCDGRRQRRVEHSLHQIWFFLAVSALLCFLLV